MGKKQRKNSNYVTEKTIQAKLEKEKAKRKKKIKKVVKQVAIGVAIVCAIAVFIWLITFLSNLDLSNKTDTSASTGTNPGATNLKPDDSYLNEVPQDQKFEATHHVTLIVEGYEQYPITIELYGNEAPETVANFVKLINEGFYNGLTFHRAVDGFMLQGGGYDKAGNSIDADEIKGEFSENGVNNPIKHLAGVISMARATDFNSASSQFFIVDETSENNTKSLDGKYAAFGRVTDGLEVIKDICDKAKSEIIALDERPVIKSMTCHSHEDGDHQH